jgi:hypothetical protein
MTTGRHVGSTTPEIVAPYLYSETHSEGCVTPEDRAGPLRHPLTLGAAFSPFHHHVYGESHVGAARVRLGDEAWEAAVAEGHAMTSEQDV